MKILTMAAAAAMACTAYAGSATAHADPISDAVNDPSQYTATCSVLLDSLDGDMTNDVPTVMGVLRAEQRYTGLSDIDTGAVVGEQVTKWCPAVRNKMIAVGTYLAQTGDSTGISPIAPATEPVDPIVMPTRHSYA